MKKRGLLILLILFIISSIIKVLFIFSIAKYYNQNHYIQFIYTDVTKWIDELIKPVKVGLIPLVDFGKEYPIGAVIIHWLLTPFYKGVSQFLLLYGFIMFIFDISATIYIFLIARLEKRRELLWLLGIWLFSPTIIILNPVRFDIIPALICLMAYYYWRKGNALLPGILLGIGTSIKWFPLFLIIPIVLNEFFVNKNLRKAVGISLLAGTSYIVINLPFLFLNLTRYGSLEMWLSPYTEQLNRFSYPDTIVGLINKFWTHVDLGILPILITAVLMLLVIFLYTNKNVAKKYILLCIAFLLFNTVYSPQFHIWFIPFMLLCLGERPYTKTTIITLELLNIMIFPITFSWLWESSNIFILCVAARWLLMAKIFVHTMVQPMSTA